MASTGCSLDGGSADQMLSFWPTGSANSAEILSSGCLKLKRFMKFEDSSKRSVKFHGNLCCQIVFSCCSCLGFYPCNVVRYSEDRVAFRLELDLSIKSCKSMDRADALHGSILKPKFAMLKENLYFGFGTTQVSFDHISHIPFNMTPRMDLNMMDPVNTSVAKSGYILASGENQNLPDTASCSLHCVVADFDNPAKPVDSHNKYEPSTEEDCCRLVLGLGPTPTSYCANYSLGNTKDKNTGNLFSKISTSGPDFDSELLQLGLSSGTVKESLPYVSTFGDGSTSAKNSAGLYMPSLTFAPRPENFGGVQGRLEMPELSDLGSNTSTSPHINLSNKLEFRLEPSVTTDCSMGDISNPTFVNISGDHNVHYHPKKCKLKRCSKGARGASGLCIAHGGGQRCQKPGCNKGADSRTTYCKAHGGGKRCQQLGCIKSAEGKTNFCIAHGGGRRCGYDGCTKAARGKSGLCIRHGGGKRCMTQGCTRSAEGHVSLCISHGGGRRCQFLGCDKGAQGSTMNCKAHGGGKRCIFEGCTKGAEGSTYLCKGHGGGKRCLFKGDMICPKSVHGGTDYCVAHGGGKRCIVPDCSKSARGRTDYCVRHGGGKRCQFEGCGKSAQGNTNFCKAHGGGKRCSWFSGCGKFARGKSGLCAAHGSMMLSQQGHTSGEGVGMPSLFRDIMSASTTVVSSMENEHSYSGDSTISDCVESTMNIDRRRLVIPPQVLAPDISYGFVIPEGRVHGGGLMSLLGGSLKNAYDIGRI